MASVRLVTGDGQSRPTGIRSSAVRSEGRDGGDGRTKAPGAVSPMGRGAGDRSRRDGLGARSRDLISADVAGCPVGTTRSRVARTPQDLVHTTGRNGVTEAG